jgi:hypothetical protein
MKTRKLIMAISSYRYSKFDMHWIRTEYRNTRSLAICKSHKMGGNGLDSRSETAPRFTSPRKLSSQITMKIQSAKIYTTSVFYKQERFTLHSKLTSGVAKVCKTFWCSTCK